MKLPWAHIVSKRLPIYELCPGVIPEPPPEPPEPPTPPTPPEPPAPPAPPEPPAPPAPPIIPPPPMPPWPPAPGPPSPPAPGPTAPTVLLVTSSTSDGTIFRYNADWPTARNTQGNAYAWDTTPADSSAMTARLFKAKYYLRRSFLFFDLSALPAGAKISSVVLYVLGFFNANSAVVILEGTQHDPLQNSDWLAFGGTIFAGATWTKGLAGQYNYNIMPLNAAGIAYVLSVRGSTAKLCLREYNYDHLNIVPTGNAPFNGMFFADHADPLRRPLLAITYK